MTTTTMKDFETSTKTRMMYALMSLGVATPIETIGAFAMYFIVDIKNLPATWYATFWFFYTIYNALNNPALGYASDRTRSRWGRRRPFILFAGMPYALTFALIFCTPFDGKDNPVALLIYFGVLIVIWEGLYTMLATGYYGLLPEMFGKYKERTDVAAKMNIFQVVALVLASVLPPLLWNRIGWGGMAISLAVISIIPIYVGFPFLFERKDLATDTSYPFLKALKLTFMNRSYLTAAGAQAMRFVATGILQMGMPFYLKYSLNVSDSMFSIFFGVAFLISMLSLYPWRNWVANKLDSRRTLMLANLVMIIGIIPLSFSPSFPFVLASAVIIGIGLGGLILMGDVIMGEVIDEDEVKTGQQRAGMYFGMSGFVITLSGLLVSSIFGILLPAFGYDTLLEVQPASVNLGFRIFLTVPTTIGLLLAIVLLKQYPLHGKRLQDIRDALAKKRALVENQDESAA
jgi:GPH family glycoside/pentoside/hexuronide:cation symporter